MKYKKLNECGVNRDQLEDAIDAYMDHSDKYDVPFSHTDMLKFVAEQLGLDEDTVDNEFGRIIDAAVNFDEDAYINACDAKFREQELKDSFMDFVHKKLARMNEAKGLDKAELMKDPGLAAYRKTQAYRASDQEGKYRMLWRYIVSEHSAKVKSEDELADVCMEIAMYDDQQF